MSYYFARTLASSHDAAIERVKTALADRGFGVLTSIDVAATMKRTNSAWNSGPTPSSERAIRISHGEHCRKKTKLVLCCLAT